MGKLVVTEYITMDGVVEAPGGGEAFRHAGWTYRIDRGAEGDEFKLEETRNTAALLFGRKTYVGMAAVWPHVSGEFAELWNWMPKYVVSSTLIDPAWNNTTVLAGEPAEEVRRLVAETEGEVVVHGSVTLVRELMEHELVDELRLMTFPTVLGSGRQLFGSSGEERRWRLQAARTVGDGVVISTYHPVFSYRLSEELPGDIDTVWHAWTNPVVYGEWFGAVPGSVRLDVREGGVWSLSVLSDDDAQETMSGSYEGVVPGQKLSVITDFDGSPTLMDIEFAPGDNGSLVTISQSSTSREERDGGREGAKILLERCADHLGRDQRRWKEKEGTGP